MRLRRISGSGSSFLRELSEGRPGTKYMLVRDMSPYAHNVYSSNDDSAVSKSSSGVALLVGGSNLVVDGDKPGGRLVFKVEVYRLLYR